jgi:hypothetical protein
VLAGTALNDNTGHVFTLLTPLFSDLLRIGGELVAMDLQDKKQQLDSLELDQSIFI